MIRLLKILLFVGLPSICQSQFNMERFLASAVDDYELMEVKESLIFLESHKFNSPWLRELDVRVRSNDRSIDLEDYRLRFGLMNPAEIIANKQYHTTIKENLNLEGEVKRSEVLKFRYLLMIESMELAEFQRLSELKLQSLQAMNEIHLSTLKSTNLDRWIAQESDLLKQQLAHEVLLKKLKINEFLIKERFDFEGHVFLDTTQIITIEQVFEITKELIQGNENSLTALLSAQKEKLSQTVLKLERAENRRNIGYVQAEYDTKRGKDLNNHLGFQVGISIPIVNPDKPDYQRELLKQLESQSRSEIQSMKDSINQEVAFMDFALLKKKLELANQKLDNLPMLKQVAVGDPEAYFKLINYEVFLYEVLTESRMDIFRYYISLLHDQGKLMDPSNTNYLSRYLNSY